MLRNINKVLDPLLTSLSFWENWCLTFLYILFLVMVASTMFYFISLNLIAFPFLLLLHLVFMYLSLLRRPLLEGDNWWRGHAAAFLRYCKLSSNDLRQGRVSQVRLMDCIPIRGHKFEVNSG